MLNEQKCFVSSCCDPLSAYPGTQITVVLSPRYTDTVVGEKHVILLLDMSGSMFGLPSDVARLSAIQLLNSLTNNDFFHVLRVDDAVTSFGGCFTGRTRASAENKLAMTSIISRTNNSYGVADFGAALDRAHDELMVGDHFFESISSSSHGGLV